LPLVNNNLNIPENLTKLSTHTLLNIHNNMSHSQNSTLPNQLPFLLNNFHQGNNGLLSNLVNLQMYNNLNKHIPVPPLSNINHNSLNSIPSHLNNQSININKVNNPNLNSSVNNLFKIFKNDLNNSNENKININLINSNSFNCGTLNNFNNINNNIVPSHTHGNGVGMDVTNGGLYTNNSNINKSPPILTTSISSGSSMNASSNTHVNNINNINNFNTTNNYNNLNQIQTKNNMIGGNKSASKPTEEGKEDKKPGERGSKKEVKKETNELLSYIYGGCKNNQFINFFSIQKLDLDKEF